MNALYPDAKYLYKYAQFIVSSGHFGSVIRPQRAIEALEVRSLGGEGGEGGDGG